ncbi:MAG: iron ABC transporter permease [Cellulomonadaceae bacterium]|jgi:thiamine transport system permease protein|nr:iron ABC transporter permease [Cellulomonadaceae bacterium]
MPAIFVALFFAWPVITMLIRGFTSDDGGGTLATVTSVMASARTWGLIRTTLLQAVIATAAATALGVPAAYLLYRTRFPGRSAVRGIITVPFVLPTVVVGVAMRALFRTDGWMGVLGLDHTMAAVVVALVFFNISVVARTVGGVWERLDPRAEQAARALGATPFRALRTVTLPQLIPAITSAAGVTFLFCATAFGVVLVLGGPQYATVETEIYRQTTQFLNLPTAAVLSLVQIVMVVASLGAAAAARRRTERTLAVTTEARAAHRWSHSNPGDVVAAIITGVTAAVLIIAPLGALLLRSFQDAHGNFTLMNYQNLGTTGSRNALNVTVWHALGTSLRTAFIAALVAMVVGSLAALVLSRRPRNQMAVRALMGFDALLMLPLGVSAVTVGFGFLVTFTTRLPGGMDIRTSGLLVPLAQAVVAIPMVVRTMLPVLRGIDPRQREVAAVLGASPARVLWTVDVPLAARSAAMALGFALAISLGEFGATAFLARPDSATLPVVIVRLMSRPGADNYAMALAASVILAALTAALMLLAERAATLDRYAGAATTASETHA